MQQTSITFKNLPESPAVVRQLREHATRLTRFFPKILACRLVLDQPHRHHHKGRLYNVRIELKVPGKQIVVNRNPIEQKSHTDVLVAIQDAFNAAIRQLKAYAEDRHRHLHRRSRFLREEVRKLEALQFLSRQMSPVWRPSPL